MKILFLVYGLFMLVGGVMGYTKAASKASLIAGVISGLLIFIGVYCLGSNTRLGWGLIVTTSGLLTVIFIIRFIKTFSWMPTGLLLGVSLLAFILSLRELIQR